MERNADSTSLTNPQFFFAGASKVDITPPLGTLIGVDFFSHYARFIHDPLYAKALVFRFKEQLIALVVVDICIMRSDFMSDVKEQIQLETGIRPENIALSATHTHGAGDVAGLLGGAVDIEYRAKLPGLIVSAVLKAKDKLRPAKIASGSVELPDHLLCRRYIMKDNYQPLNPVTGGVDRLKTNPFGVEKYIDRSSAPVDPGVGFLAVKGLDDGWIALLGNYCSHYVGDWDVDTITADYYGAFSRQVQEKLKAGNEFVGMMTYGTGGDVNIWDFLHPDRYPDGYFKKTELISNDLSNKVIGELAKVQWQDNPTLSIQYEELSLSIRKPTKEELTVAADKLAKFPFNNLEIDDHGMSMVYAREQVLLSEYPDVHRSAIQAIQIGDLGIGVLGGEIFSETGLWLKKQVRGNNYFTICLANTYDGYVPPAHEMEKGGYETWRARSSFLERDAESKIRNKLLELIQGNM